MNKEVSGEPGLPKGASFELSRSDPIAPVGAQPFMPPAPGSKEGADRNEIFSRLVQGDADIAGLVAYSIYKQNKLDWLAAFEAARSRAPDEAELFSYIVGEGTPRRLATYRQLAEATLAGDGSTDGRPRRLAAPGGTGAATPALIATYALIAVLFVVGFWLAAHFTLGH